MTTTPAFPETLPPTGAVPTRTHRTVVAWLRAGAPADYATFVAQSRAGTPALPALGDPDVRQLMRDCPGILRLLQLRGAYAQTLAHDPGTPTLLEWAARCAARPLLECVDAAGRLTLEA